MWDSLWHLRGTTPVPHAMPDPEVIERIERLLGQQRKPVTSRAARALVFEAPFWWASLNANWLAMLIYERGRFRIENDTRGRVIRYELRSFCCFLLCLFVAGIFFLLGLRLEGLVDGIAGAAFAFAWLYGANLAFARARIPGTIRKALE